MASLTLWTWVWVNSGSWWWTGRPGVLRFMGLQRVRHDWTTEQKLSHYQSKIWLGIRCFMYLMITTKQRIWLDSQKTKMVNKNIQQWEITISQRNPARIKKRTRELQNSQNTIKKMALGSSCICTQSFSHVWLWPFRLQAPLSMEFFSQEYGSGLLFPPPGDLPRHHTQVSCITGEFFSADPLRKPSKF